MKIQTYAEVVLYFKSGAPNLRDKNSINVLNDCLKNVNLQNLTVF